MRDEHHGSRWRKQGTDRDGSFPVRLPGRRAKGRRFARAREFHRAAVFARSDRKKIIPLSHWPHPCKCKGVYNSLKFPVYVALVISCLLPTRVFCQQDPDNAAQTDKRVFWIVPNYRTSPSLTNYTPLTVAQKFTIAGRDSFDFGTVALAAVVGGEGQLTNADPSFGQGGKGYAHYAGTAYADFVLGHYMTEAVFPTILHQDPRYFRRGTGSKMSRLVYSAGQTFLTHSDSGQTQFNYSEIAGNSSAVAISMAYRPDNRNFGDAASKFGLLIGTDMASNLLKEFRPDIMHKFSRKHRQSVAVK